MKQIIEHLIAAIALVIISVIFVDVCVSLKQGDSADHQARQWLVTLDPSKRASGQPWQAEISATSYDRARATARERFSWADDTFSVAPVVENYLDVRQVRITP